MPEFYSYKGLRNGGTFLLDATTAEKIKNDPLQICGKVVTLVDNYTVGYGSSGKRPLGFVEMVEHERNFSEQWVVSVVWNRSTEMVPCAGSETAGDYVACDGSGGVTTSANATPACVWGVDSDNKVATVYIHG